MIWQNHPGSRGKGLEESWWTGLPSRRGTLYGVPVRTWMAPREETLVKTLDDHHNPRQLQFFHSLKKWVDDLNVNLREENRNFIPRETRRAQLYHV